MCIDVVLRVRIYFDCVCIDRVCIAFVLILRCVLSYCACLAVVFPAVVLLDLELRLC